MSNPIGRIPLALRLQEFVGSGAVGEVFRSRRLGIVVKIAEDEDSSYLDIEAQFYAQLQKIPEARTPRLYGHFTNIGYSLLVLEDCGEPFDVDELDELPDEARSALRRNLMIIILTILQAPTRSSHQNPTSSRGPSSRSRCSKRPAR